MKINNKTPVDVEIYLLSKYS